MISKQDLERILDREGGGNPVFSLYLDMSVNSDNKRTHRVFLNQRHSQFQELDSDRANHHLEDLGAVFERVDQWLDDEFQEENRGVVIYAEIGGDWFEALQFPVPVQNRLVIGERPVIGPLAQVIESYHHHGVILLDREHVRLLSVYLGTLLDEVTVEGEPYPAPHDVQPGGYSQARFQRRKREEMRHFFREFAKEVEEFDRRYQMDDLVILGTDETVARFKEFLPDRLLEKVIYTGHMRTDETSSTVLQRLQPHLDAERARESEELIKMLRDRVQHDYMATAGFRATLSALQEGRVDTLVIREDQREEEGVRCTTCGYIFKRGVDTCPYDGNPTEDGVNVTEEAIRIAETQGAHVEFVNAGELESMRGIGALLRF